MKVVLVCNKKEFNDIMLERLKTLGQVSWYDGEKTDLLTISELTNSEPKVLAMSPVPLGWQVPNAFYDKVQNLQAICIPTTGFEFLDTDKLKTMGVTLSNTPYYSTNAVAEYAVFMMLALLKKFPLQLQANHEYKFTDANLAEDCKGKRAGIIGLGHIGGRIAELAEALGMEVVYWSRSPKDARYQRLELDELLVTTDVLFPAYETNSSTAGILNADALQKLRPAAYLVSIMHGGVDANLLIQQVRQGKLAGVALEDKQLATQRPRGNLFITAPLAWYSKESLEKNIELWADAIEAAIKNRPINLVP